jgi:hypothetical protein
MSAQLLALFKVSLLVLLYLFLFRVVRAVWAELQSPPQGLVNPVDPTGPPSPVPSRRPSGVPVAEPPTGASAVLPPRHPQPASTLTQLVVVAPESLAGRTFPLGAGEVTIGRSSACTIALDDAFVSTQHARVFADPASGWWRTPGRRTGRGSTVNVSVVPTTCDLVTGSASVVSWRSSDDRAALRSGDRRR